MSGSKKKRRAPVIIVILFLVFIAVPLAVVGLSFIGKIAPDSVLPDSFDIYVSIPNAARLAENALSHEALPDVMALAELAPLMHAFNQAQNSGAIGNRWVRWVAGGRLKAALLPEDRFVAAWDAGIVSPLLRFLPAIARGINVPGLFFVRAGSDYRFEYRLDDGTVFFIGRHRNLLVVSNNAALFESAQSDASRDGRRASSAVAFRSRNHDIAFLFSPRILVSLLEGDAADPRMLSALNLLEFQDHVEASLLILPNQLNIHLAAPLGTESEALQKIITRNSQVTPILSMIPRDAQYMTMLAAGGLRELLDGASAIAAGTAPGPDLENALRMADNASRFALRMSLEELLFSWTGTQFAAFGLEGRPHPVFAIEISDEAMRRSVFDRAFGTIFLTEDVRLNLDGNRIPRIQVPNFLASLLAAFGVNIPSPFYTIHNNYLLISESAETLLAAVNAVRRNEVLPRQDLWRALSADNSGPATVSLFYSLDRSIPLFLRGNSDLAAVLGLYRQGLVRLSLEDSVLRVSMSVIPGAGRGIVPVVGYPLDLTDQAQGRVGNRLFSVSSGRDSRLLVTRGRDVLAINPIDRSIRELRGFGSPQAIVHAIPQTPLRSPSYGEVWVVDTFGNVNLTNRDLENLGGFPISTGIRLSAPPRAWGGRLFLNSEDGAVYTVDSMGSVSRWGAFSAAVRASPSFLDFNNRTFVALYPRDIIFGEIFVLDGAGVPLPNWPVPVPGIAFGSPLLFSARHSSLQTGSQAALQERLFAAFITQAGTLAVYADTAEMLPGFPLELDGVFFLQPVFDGESLWIIESEGTLYRVSLGGEVFSQRVPRLTVREEGYIAVAGDRVLFAGEGNALHGYSLNFNSLSGFPLPVWGRPVIGGILGSGGTELAGVGMDNRLYMWQFRR